MDVKTETRRVLAIAERLGVAWASVVDETDWGEARRECLVGLEHGGRFAGVNVANYERAAAALELRAAEGKPGSPLIAEVFVPAGEEAGVPPALSAVYAIAKWAGVRESVARQVHDTMAVSSMRARRAAATRRARIKALIEALPARITAEAIDHPDQADEVIARLVAEVRGAKVDMSALQYKVASAVVERLGGAEAAGMSFSREFRDSVLTLCTNGLIKRVAVMLNDGDGAVSEEGFRRIMWSELESFPMSVRTRQSSLLASAENVAGIWRRAAQAGRPLWTHGVLHLAARARSRAEMSTLLLLDSESHGELGVPWAAVSGRQHIHEIDRGRNPSAAAGQECLAPYASNRELRDEVQAFLDGDHHGLYVPVDDITVDESGGTGWPMGESVMKPGRPGYGPKKVATSVAGIALLMGVDSATVHAREMVAEAGTAWEYLVELGGAGRRGVVRVANVALEDRGKGLSAAAIEWSDETAIVDVRDRKSMGAFGTLGTPGDAIMPIARWAGLDEGDARSRLRAYRQSESERAGRVMRGRIQLADPAAQMLINGEVPEYTVLKQVFPQAERGELLAAAIVERIGIWEALGHGFSPWVASLIQDYAVQGIAGVLRGQIDSGEAGETIEDVRRATWNLLRPYPLAVRCAQAGVLEKAGVWCGGRGRDYGVMRGWRTVAGLRLTERAPAMAAALYRPAVPAEVPAWVWFSDMQEWMAKSCEGALRPPDAVLEPYRDAASIRADLETLARDGHMFVPLTMPGCLTG